MKKQSILLLGMVIAAVTASSQTINAGYLDPKLGTGTPYKYIRFGNETEFYGGFMLNNTSDPYGDGDDFSIFTYDNRDITVRTGWGNFIVFPNEGGNVGIGTINPQAKLAVNGNILATEVKVKTNIAVPDYVFEPDYHLQTLAEIEAFVKKHKHLPEIPSAADIKRDGLDLAEINLLLLRKVEELTLHLIEKEKAENKQNERIEGLEKQLKLISTNKIVN